MNHLSSGKLSRDKNVILNCIGESSFQTKTMLCDTNLRNKNSYPPVVSFLVIIATIWAYTLFVTFNYWSPSRFSHDACQSDLQFWEFSTPAAPYSLSLQLMYHLAGRTKAEWSTYGTEMIDAASRTTSMLQISQDIHQWNDHNFNQL